MSRLTYTMCFIAYALNILVFICSAIDYFIFDGDIKQLIFITSMILLHGYVMIFNLLTDD